MEFYSAYNTPKTIPSPTGDGTEVDYVLRTNKTTGVKDLEPMGVKNVYELIQAAKEDTLIQNILERYKNGDTSVIAPVSESSFIDITEMPESLADAQNRLLVAEDMFNSLSVDVRAKYGHDFGQFLASANNNPESVLSDLGFVKADTLPAEPVTPVLEPSEPVIEGVKPLINTTYNNGGVTNV